MLQIIGVVVPGSESLSFLFKGYKLDTIPYLALDPPREKLYKKTVFLL